VVKTFDDPFFPDAIDRHLRASDILRSVLPDTPRAIVYPPDLIVSPYVGFPEVAPTSVLPLRDCLPFVPFDQLLIHAIACLVIGKGDALDNALAYQSPTSATWHIAPIDNSYTFFELPPTTTDNFFDTLEFDEELARLILDHPHISHSQTISRLLAANKVVNADHPIFHKTITTNASLLKERLRTIS
jgi:hypothetical protein